jgi:hypothetical protein
MLVFPTFADTTSRYQYDATVDGKVYKFRFRFSIRAASWYMSIQQPDGTELISEVRLVANFPLTLRKQDNRLPPGVFLLLDLTGTGADVVNQSDLGESLNLVYVFVDELPDQPVSSIRIVSLTVL